MGEERVTIWDRIDRLDRRVLYWLVLIALVIPSIYPLGLPVKTEVYVKAAYDFMESLPEGSLILYWIEGSAGMWPDVLPGAKAVMWHIYQKKFKFVIIAGGYSVDHMVTTRKIWEEVGHPSDYGYEYGVDWAYFGFFPGLEAGFASVANDFRSVYSIDYYGNPIDELPIMEGVNRADDFDAIWVFLYGGGWEWAAKHATIAWGVPSLYVTVGAITPEKMSYYRQGATTGCLGGVRDTAAYEMLIGRPASAVKRADALNIALLHAFVWIVIGNIALAARRAGGRS